MTTPGIREKHDAARYFSILNHHVDLVCRCTPELVLTFVNDAFCHFFGRPRHMLLGMNFRDLIVPEAQGDFIAAFAELETDAPVAVYEYLSNTPDGVCYWLRWEHRAIPDADGRLCEYQSIGHDITCNKFMEVQLREREERYRAIVASAAMGICLVDEYGQFLECNPAFAQMTGYSPEELAVLTLSQLVHPDDAAKEQHCLADLWRGAQGEYTLEKRLLTQNGGTRWVLAMTTVIRDVNNVPQYAVQVLEDITARKDAERVRTEYQEKLRALTLNSTLTEERERRRIAQNLHDHIGQSLAISKLLLGRLATSLNGTDSEGHRQLDEIRSILGDMLDYSRTLTCELSPPVLHELGLMPGLKWLATHFTERYHLPTDLEISHGIPALSHEMRIILYHITRELLINVVKHAQASRAALYLKVAGGELYLTIADDGRGMDDEANREADGHGFGLFSVRERVGQLGGTFTVTSMQGCGTRCELRVPLPPAHETCVEREGRL